LRRAARGQYQNRIKIEASKTHYRAHATSLIFCYIRSFLKVFGDIFLRCLAENYYGVWRRITKEFGEFSAHNLINETTFILFQYFKGRLGLLIEERWVQRSCRLIYNNINNLISTTIARETTHHAHRKYCI
jgi:hypothetical protein